MTKYVKNPDGVVHSVDDSFEFPDETWADATAKDASPQLLGEPDPVVTAVELHSGDTTPAPEETPEEVTE